VTRVPQKRLERIEIRAAMEQQAQSVVPGPRSKQLAEAWWARFFGDIDADSRAAAEILAQMRKGAV
jgi:hypothetical protein